MPITTLTLLLNAKAKKKSFASGNMAEKNRVRR